MLKYRLGYKILGHFGIVTIINDTCTTYDDDKKKIALGFRLTLKKPRVARSTFF